MAGNGWLVGGRGGRIGGLDAGGMHWRSLWCLSGRGGGFGRRGKGGEGGGAAWETTGCTYSALARYLGTWR